MLFRSHVSNWKAYTYSLLKKFDESAYEAMKASEGKRARPKPRVDKEKQVSAFSFNASAAEFVPRAFAFNAGAMEFTPPKGGTTDATLEAKVRVGKSVKLALHAEAIVPDDTARPPDEISFGGIVVGATAWLPLSCEACASSDLCGSCGSTGRHGS